MTIEDSIKDIKECIKPIVGGISLDVAIEALEKQLPKEVEIDIINRGISVSGEYDIDSNMLCPNCKTVVGDYENNELYFNWCPDCGQKVKYSDA